MWLVWHWDEEKNVLINLKDVCQITIQPVYGELLPYDICTADIGGNDCCVYSEITFERAKKYAEHLAKLVEYSQQHHDYIKCAMFIDADKIFDIGI